MTSDGWTYYTPTADGTPPPRRTPSDTLDITVEFQNTFGHWRYIDNPSWLTGTPYRYRDVAPYSGCGKCNHPACGQCFPQGEEPPLPMDMPENPKAIYGRAKPSLGLFPSAALIECAGVFQSGADKYGLANWRKDPVESMTYVHASLRHIFKWVDGQNQDEESGSHELAHAIACLAILIDADYVDRLIDDRPHEGRAADHLAARTKPIP